MELWALTKTLFILIPIVLIYCLNSLLIKFLPILYMTKSSSPRYILILTTILLLTLYILAEAYYYI